MAVCIRRIVVDALKPREVPIVELSKVLCNVGGAEQVDIIVAEVDAKTETVKVTLKGEDINYEEMVGTMDQFGAVIRSIDEISTHKSSSERTTK